MATAIAIIWPVPLLLIGLALGVVLVRNRVAGQGGLQPPYETPAPTEGVSENVHDGEAPLAMGGPVIEHETGEHETGEQETGEQEAVELAVGEHKPIEQETIER